MKQDLTTISIPKEKFEFVNGNEVIKDKKFDTKPVGYLKDAFRRFRKDKSSVVAAIILAGLALFAIVGPYFFNQGYIKSYATSTEMKRYKYLNPKLKMFEGTGFWDGTIKKNINEIDYVRYNAMSEENGYPTIAKDFGVKELEIDGSISKMHSVRLDTYHTVDVFQKTFTEDEYKAIQAWQDEKNMQVILPWVDYYDSKSDYELIKNSKVLLNNKNIYYECDAKGRPTYDESGNLIKAYRTGGTDDFYTSTVRSEGDPYYDSESHTGRWKYCMVGGNKKEGRTYSCRINSYNFFLYTYGFEPAFAFGSDGNGYDILTRLASGARFSLLFAVAISAINLIIGAIYGAIEGYYGGVADMIMERFSDILSSLPTMVITVLFNLHLTKVVGVVPALLFAFIATGWIGMASTVRMQFYRFKNQEYVLAARTLGARDWRIMFKHIFPNSLGTIITSTVLVIPGVIFSETSLTYLGIINLDSPTRSSVGAMLNAGKDVMEKHPFAVLFPALFIGLLMVCFNLFGNGLRDAFNPSLRGTED